jgi:hypothetical protein
LIFWHFILWIFFVLNVFLGNSRNFGNFSSAACGNVAGEAPVKGQK